MELQKQKLQKAGQMAKVEEQEKEKEEPSQEDEDASMDTNEMPILISDNNDEDGMKDTKKKQIFNKKPTKLPPRKK